MPNTVTPSFASADPPPIGDDAARRALPAGYTVDPPATAGVATRTLPPGATLDFAPTDADPATRTLPAGFTIDRPGTATGATTSPPTTNWWDRAGGIAGRGIVQGAGDIVSLAQAAGRVADRGWAATGLPDPTGGLDTKLDNVPVAQDAGRELDRQGFYQPTGLAGRATEAAVEGLTGGALTGGAGSASLLGANAAAGAAGAVGQAAGLSPTEAAALSLAVGGGPGAVSAARAAAGSAAAAHVVSTLAPEVTSKIDAASSVVRSQAMIDRMQQATPAATPTALAQSASGQLQGSLQGHVAMLRRVNLVSPDDASDLQQAIRDAADPENTGAAGKALVDGLDLPEALAKPMRDGLADLGTLSSGVLQSPAAGPLRTVGQLAAKYGAPAAAALAGLHAGDFGPALEGGAALLGLAHRPVSGTGAVVGGVLDRVAGTRVLPGQAIVDAAGNTLAGASPGALPTDQIADVRAAYRDAQDQVRAEASDAAAAAIKAKQTAAAYAANAATMNAADAAWTKAMAQRDQQAAVGAPDPLSSALWRDAEASAAPNLAAVTASQVRGFGADQSALASRDAFEAAQQAAMEARGRALAEQAGAWWERKQVAGFKQANPGVPVMGAGSVGARDPQALFEATNGLAGNPSAASLPATGFQGTAEAPPAAPTSSLLGEGGPGAPGTPGSPVGAPGGSMTAPVPPPPAPAYGPFPPASNLGLVQPATGGKALAEMMHRQRFGGPAPTDGEMASAIDDIAADGLVHPMEADAAHQGQNVSPAFALTIAHRVQAARSIPQGAAGQASAEVAGLTGGGAVPGSAPNGPSAMGAPISNLPRWQSAATDYQRHAAGMAALAIDPDARQAISEIAATPRAVDKQAIRDVYAARKPGSPDLIRFTPRLMRGV